GSSSGVPDRGAHGLHDHRRRVLHHAQPLLRPGRRLHHHRAGRRHRLPHRHPQEGQTVITIERVRREYSSEVGIGPVDLVIPAGGITALIGPNGAGKSTLLTMAGRLMGMDAGSIEIAGYDVTSTR